MAIEAGISLDRFWGLTWRELILYIKANENKELKQVLLFRRVAYQIYMSYPKKRDEAIDKFWPHPWDKQPDRGNPISEQDVLKAIKLYSNNGNGNPTA